MNHTFHNQSMETASRDELSALQSARLTRIVRHVYEKNPVQQARFQAMGLPAEEIRSLDDLQRLPLMSKEHLREYYPLRMCCVTKEQLVGMHMSSGSTGTPVVMPYTAADIAQWGECMARCYRMAGAVPGDVVQITPSFGLFNGGFGFYHGARAL